MSEEEKTHKVIIPKWLRDEPKNNVKKSKKHELRLAEKLEGKREPRSGANTFSKWVNRSVGRDITTPKFLVEHKFTEAASISLKKEWLDKIKEASTGAMKEPVLIVTFETNKKIEDWAVIPLDLFKRLTDNINEEIPIKEDE